MMSESARGLAQYLGKDYLFGIAKGHLFSHVYNENREAAADKLLNLLTVSSRLGHEEATWLLSWHISNIYCQKICVLRSPSWSMLVAWMVCRINVQHSR